LERVRAATEKNKYFEKTRWSNQIPVQMRVGGARFAAMRGAKHAASSDEEDDE